MSDFDKEAEREKLRKKYEEEEEKREATEQMSELLLKGATMTNAHCSECGDPIFRYDGQEFCPTCQKPVDRGTDEQAGSSSDDGSGQAEANGTAGDEQIEVTTPSNDASVQFGGADVDAESGASAGQTSAETTDGPTEGQGSHGSDPARQSPSVAPRKTAGPDQEPGSYGGRTSTTNPESAETATGSAGDHLRRAQAVLARTVEVYARQAAEADDPREARERLKTAREAAETLDATGF